MQQGRQSNFYETYVSDRRALADLAATLQNTDAIDSPHTAPLLQTIAHIK